MALLCKRDDDKVSIFRKSLESPLTELVSEITEYSFDTFLSVSPDGKYLAFVYVDRKKIGDDTVPLESPHA